TGTHVVKLVDAATGQDVAGGSVTVSMSGGTPGQFQYASLSSPVTLLAGHSYYLVVQETQGGDWWYNYDTLVTTTTAAAVSKAAYAYNGGAFTTGGIAGQEFGPVSLLYPSK